MTPPDFGKTLAGLALTLLSPVVLAQSWIDLAIGAFTYEVSDVDAATNVVVDGEHAFVAVGSSGIAHINLTTGQVALVEPVAGMDSIDDIAVADGLVFALDARDPGAVAVFSLDDTMHLNLASGPVAVPVEPFSGVAAAGGSVIVSGGTKQLTLRHYTEVGTLSDVKAMLDVGRGQPDILLTDDGRHGVVSTHTFGKDFGITLVAIDKEPPQVSVLASIPLPDAGFTPGGIKPANFPIETVHIEDWLLVANGGGVAVIDVRDWEKPSLEAEIDIDLHSVNIDAHGGVAAVVGKGAGNEVVLLDISNLPSVTRLKRVPLSGATVATGVALDDDVILVAQQEEGYKILDRDPPSARQD